MAQFVSNLLKNLTGGKLPTMAIRLGFLIENFAVKLSCQVSGFVFHANPRIYPHTELGVPVRHTKKKCL